MVQARTHLIAPHLNLMNDSYRLDFPNLLELKLISRAAESEQVKQFIAEPIIHFKYGMTWLGP